MDNDFIVKSDRTLAFDKEGFSVGFSYFTIFAKINRRRELVRFVSIQNWERMDRNSHVIATLTVEADLVEIISEGHNSCGCEIDRQYFADTRWHHTLLVVFNFEVVSLSGKYMKSLRRWGNIEHIHFNSVGLVCFKPCKFDLCGLNKKGAISSHKFILGPINREASHCFSAG